MKILKIDTTWEVILLSAGFHEKTFTYKDENHAELKRQTLEKNRRSPSCTCFSKVYDENNETVFNVNHTDYDLDSPLSLEMLREFVRLYNEGNAHGK